MKTNDLIWRLRDVHAFDASDIEGDEVELIGEDIHGNEGTFTVSITELMGNAADKIEELKETLDFANGELKRKAAEAKSNQAEIEKLKSLNCEYREALAKRNSFGRCV